MAGRLSGRTSPIDTAERIFKAATAAYGAGVSIPESDRPALDRFYAKLIKEEA